MSSTRNINIGKAFFKMPKYVMWISTIHVVPQGNPLMEWMTYSKNPGLCLCSM